MSAGEGSEGGEDESAFGEPKARGAEMTTGGVFHPDDGMEVATDGEDSGGICGVVDDMNSIECQSGDAFQMMGVESPLIVIS